MQLTRLLNRHLLSKALVFITNTIASILLSRCLEASDTGSFFYYISWLNFFVLMATLGFDSSAIYFISRKKIDSSHFIFSGVIWSLTFMIFFLFAGYLIASEWSFFQTIAFDPVFYGVLFIAGQLWTLFFSAIASAKQDFIKPSFIIFILNLIFIAILIIFSIGYLPWVNKDVLMRSFIILNFLQGFIIAIIYLDQEVFNIKFSSIPLAEIKNMLIYSFLAYATNIVFYISTRIDLWVIKLWDYDSGLYGNYMQVTRIMNLFQIFPAILASFIFPVMAGRQDKFLPQFSCIVRLFIVIMVPVLCVLCLVGKSFFPFLFGNSFDSMNDFFILLVPGIFSLTILAFTSAFFAAINLLKIDLLLSSIGFLFILIADLIFIPIYGIKAAAIIRTISFSVCLIVALIFFKKYSGIKLRELMTFSKTDILYVRNLLTKY